MALHGRLGQPEAARATLDELEANKPGVEPVRWAEAVPFVRSADREALIDALRAAVGGGQA